MKPQFVVVTDSTGAYALLSKAVADEFGYDKTQDDVTPDKFARMLARELEIKDARKKKVSDRLNISGSEHGTLMLGTVDSEEVRGEVGIQAPPGPEADHDNMEGGQSLPANPTDEAGGASGDLHLPGMVRPWVPRSNRDDNRAEVSESTALSITSS